MKKKTLIIKKLNNFFVLLKKDITRTWIRIFILTIIGIAIGTIFGYPQFEEWYNNKDIPNINWKWEVSFYTEKSSYNPYIWMKTNYHIFLNNNKNTFSWKWEKWAVNNKELDFNQHNKINIEGTLFKRNLNWIYTLEWSNRPSDWNIEVIFNKNWKEFNWNFHWNWADVSWTVSWIKVEIKEND